MATQVVNIPALFSSLATKVDVALFSRETDPFHCYYDYGRYLEVTRNLSAKDGGITTKNKKYPLIWLVVPYTVVETLIGGGCEIKGMQIIIATVTKQASTTPDRYATNFIPRLYPIYDELRKQIDKSGYFIDLDFDNVHERVDQPYWDGKENSSSGNLFGDFIDAIQLKNIRLKVNEETCNKFQLIGG